MANNFIIEDNPPIACTFTIYANDTSWENIAGSPYDNTALAEILNSKVDNSTVEALSETVDNNYNTLDGKIDTHIADKTNPHEVTKAQVGLGNCDNTSDLNKPISTATQTALDGKVDKLSTKPTAGTYTKVTINNEGQVTTGTTLLASDIPSFALSKISDVTASASEVNILDGATLTTTELNYVDGVTSPIQTQISANANDISDIQDLIPNQASSLNQLADKQYVNSAIQTNSAHFRGNWSTWANVPTDVNDYPADDDGNKTPTTNDYMVVQNASDYTGETLTGAWQFTYTGLWSTNGKAGWQPRFQINESPLTPSQQAALDSGITSALVSQIGTNQSNIQGINTTLSGYGNIVTHNVNEFATAGQGAKADTALQQTDIVSSVDSSSTNTKAVGAKLFYDTCGDIETLINAL